MKQPTDCRSHNISECYNSSSSNFDREKSYFRWLKKLTVNLIFDKKKWKRRHRTERLQDLSFDIIDIEETETFEITANEIHLIMDSLSPLKRQVFNLYYVEGYSHKEISHILGITENGSSSVLSKVRKELAEKITDYINKNK